MKIISYFSLFFADGSKDAKLLVECSSTEETEGTESSREKQSFIMQIRLAWSEVVQDWAKYKSFTGGKINFSPPRRENK